MEDSLATGERPDLAALFDRPVTVRVQDFDMRTRFGVAVEYYVNDERRRNAVRVPHNTKEGLLEAVQVLKDWVGDD